MAQHLLEVRVRPIRITVLVSRSENSEALLLAFRLLSKVWGGRYGQILAVDPETCDELTGIHLAESRPELVYGIGLDNDKWAMHVSKACQPRIYCKLTPDTVANFSLPNPQNFLYDHYKVDHALIHLMRTRGSSPNHHRRLRLVSASTNELWSLLVGAIFGVHHQNLKETYRDDITTFSDNTATELVKLATEFVKNYQQSWLDVTGYELIPLLYRCHPVSPTIVIVRELVRDLSLFWNFRSASDAVMPAWVIPIPESCLEESELLAALKDWLLAFLPYGPRPNYCHVTSASVDENTCRGFASRLKGALAETPFEAVDYMPPPDRFPVIVPFEYETAWAVEISGRRLTIHPPKPRVFEAIDTPRMWVVDLRKDIKTGRSVGELSLPSTPVAFELLNGPCPPYFEHRIIPRTGVGPECLNIVCSGQKEVVNLYLPTETELLEELLREHGVEPQADEKRASYLPIIKRFGGLHRAASAFSGQSGRLLVTLAQGTKTHPEIQNALQLKTSDDVAENFDQRIEQFLMRETERMKRVGHQRFKHYARGAQPENMKLRSLLEFWADRSILTREWKLGPCSQCRQQYFVPSLNIQRRVVCIHCGHRITLPATVPIGYTLHKAVKHAVNQGIMPVVLTGRFLSNLSTQGFLWLPGVKYQSDTGSGDIDVVACCDGHLVFCECKQLDQTPSEANVWNKVIEQFLRMLEIAKRCQASLVVLAALVEQYPQKVVEEISDGIKNTIPYLLLTKADLEQGFRQIEDQGFKRWLMLEDLLQVSYIEQPRQPDGVTRKIDYGWGSYIHQPAKRDES